MVGKLERAIADIEADLEKARAAGDERKVKELEDNLASRRSFLEMAAEGRLRSSPADATGCVRDSPWLVVTR